MGLGVPRGDDLDVAVVRGNIRNVALHTSPPGGGTLGMAALITATEREYRKLGRLCVESEFGAYRRLLSA